MGQAGKKKKKKKIQTNFKRFYIFSSEKIVLHFWMLSHQFISYFIFCVYICKGLTKKLNLQLLFIQVTHTLTHENKKALSPFYRNNIFLIENECKAPKQGLFQKKKVLPFLKQD